MSEAHKRGDGLLHYGQTILLLAMHLILIMSGLSHASDFQASRSSLWAYSGRVQHMTRVWRCGMIYRSRSCALPGCAAILPFHTITSR